MVAQFVVWNGAQELRVGFLDNRGDDGRLRAYVLAADLRDVEPGGAKIDANGQLVLTGPLQVDKRRVEVAACDLDICDLDGAFAWLEAYRAARVAEGWHELPLRGDDQER